MSSCMHVPLQKKSPRRLPLRSVRSSAKHGELWKLFDFVQWISCRSWLLYSGVLASWLVGSSPAQSPAKPASMAFATVLRCFIACAFATSVRKFYPPREHVHRKRAQHTSTGTVDPAMTTYLTLTNRIYTHPHLSCQATATWKVLYEPDDLTVQIHLAVRHDVAAATELRSVLASV